MKLHRCLFVAAFVVANLFLLSFSSVKLPVYAAAGQASTVLQLTSLERVYAGQPFTLTVEIEGAVDLAGYEAVLLFDDNAAEFVGLSQRQNGVRSSGRAVEPLEGVAVDGGLAFGFFSCPAESCLSLAGQTRRGGDGSFQLSEFHFTAQQIGPISFRLAAAKFVDSAGAEQVVALPEQPTVVQVEVGAGDDSSADSMANESLPFDSWSLGNGEVDTLGPFDLTGDGLVTYGDVAEVALAWQASRRAGAPCHASASAFDVDRSGCVDVGDVQRTVVAYSRDAANPPVRAAASPMNFVVNSTGDEPDINQADGVCLTAENTCTLRAAILAANANPGPDDISFAIEGSGVHTIQLTDKLPALNDTNGGVSIDGYTQPGAQENTDLLVSNAQLMIEVRGLGTVEPEGSPVAYEAFTVLSTGNTIRGLAIYNSVRELTIDKVSAASNRIVGNFIGTNAAGTFGAAGQNEAGEAHGIHITNGASRNQIGSPDPGDRNVISGNALSGVALFHEGTSGNSLYNNLIGLTPNGAGRLRNQRHGVDMNFGTINTQVGGVNPAEGNVISGNGNTGVDLSHSPEERTRENRVEGNLIGTDVNGQCRTPREYNFSSNRYGMIIKDGVTNNLVAYNVIGCNRLDGIYTRDNYTPINTIANNWIGAAPDGGDIGNGRYGILLKGHDHVIGPNNVFANNKQQGIFLVDRDLNEQPDPVDDNYGNIVTRNSMYNNGGLGIDIEPSGVNPNDEGDADSGPNTALNFPELTTATTQAVAGTACVGCIVEIFVADSEAGEYGEGETFLGDGPVGEDGQFLIGISAEPGAALTATARDAAGNTSEFSLNILVVAEDLLPTPTPAPTQPVEPTATPTPSPTSLATATRIATATATATATQTPNAPANPSATSTPEASPTIPATPEPSGTSTAVPTGTATPASSATPRAGTTVTPVETPLPSATPGSSLPGSGMPYRVYISLVIND